jgi:hypothetical protein
MVCLYRQHQVAQTTIRYSLFEVGITVSLHTTADQSQLLDVLDFLDTPS